MTKYKCSDCGAPIGADYKACPKCGERFEEGSGWKSSPYLVLALVVAILLSAVMLFYFRDTSSSATAASIGAATLGVEPGNALEGQNETPPSNGTDSTPSNIRPAAPTPSSCTPTQNCGSPTCVGSRGGGCSSGCGGRR